MHMSYCRYCRSSRVSRLYSQQGVPNRDRPVAGHLYADWELGPDCCQPEPSTSGYRKVVRSGTRKPHSSTSRSREHQRGRRRWGGTLAAARHKSGRLTLGLRLSARLPLLFAICKQIQSQTRVKDIGVIK